MYYILTLFVLCFMQSCIGIVFGGVAMSTKAFVGNDYRFINSELLRKTEQEVQQILEPFQNGYTNEVKIIEQKQKVFVAGIVSNEYIKEQIDSILEKNFGECANEIIVEKVRRNKIVDFYLKAKILDAMLFTKYVRSGNYNVIVLNKRTYIFGYAKNKDEEKILVNALSEVKGIKDVIIYIS